LFLKVFKVPEYNIFMAKTAKRKNPVIALAQIKYFDTAEKHNVTKIKKYIRLAKKRGADIICFPESVVHKTTLLNMNHELIKDIREECKKNSIWCIIDDDIEIRGKIYNSAVLINRKGEIAGSYQKINIMGEGYNSQVHPGKRIKVIKTDFASIGLAICWDLSSPKLFREMKNRGADIIFCPTYWKYEARAYRPRVYAEKNRQKEFEVLKSLVMARAFENLFFVALCNPAKNDREKDLVPYSAICSPQKILKEIKDEEGLIVSEINLDEIGKLEKLYEEAAG
jgi:predicted amidohydrolase